MSLTCRLDLKDQLVFVGPISPFFRATALELTQVLGLRAILEHRHLADVTMVWLIRNVGTDIGQNAQKEQILLATCLSRHRHDGIEALKIIQVICSARAGL